MIIERKYIAKILTILAGIFFLVHTAVPHHHHDSQVCIKKEHCVNCAIPSGQNQEEHNHPYDKNNHTHKCCVSEFVPASLTDAYKSGKYLYSGDKYLHDFHFSLLSDNTRILTPSGRFISFNPGIARLYSLIVYSSSGLRAPPVV